MGNFPFGSVLPTDPPPKKRRKQKINGQARAEGIAPLLFDDLPRQYAPGKAPTAPSPSPTAKRKYTRRKQSNKLDLKAWIIDKITHHHRESSELPEWVRKLIKITASILFGVSVTISTYYSFAYFCERTNVFMAACFTILVVGSANVLQTIAGKIMFRNLKSFILGLAMFAIGFSSMVYSMSNTFSALYNGRTASVEAVNTGKADEIMKKELYNRAKMAYDLAMEAYGMAKGDYDAAVKDMEYQSKVMESIADKTSKEYATERTRFISTRTNRDAKAKARDDARKALDEKAKELDAVSTVESVAGTELKRATFEDWIGGRLGTDGDTVEFGLGLFPSIGADLIAPIMLSLALFF